MNKIILNPLFAPVCVVIYIALFFVGHCTSTADRIFAFTETETEVITYVAYILAVPVIAVTAPLFKGKFVPFSLFTILFGCAWLREMGVQHWLTTTDSTAFKIRFFTNPNNPLSEKIVAFLILASVALMVIYLLIKYTPALIKGFFRFNPIAWTVCTLGGTMIVGKFFDRLPSNYEKMTGTELAPLIDAYVVLFEEVSESTLPLLFALALIQYALSKRSK